MTVPKRKGFMALLIISFGIHISLASFPVPPAGHGARSMRIFPNYTLSSSTSTTTTLSNTVSQNLISTLGTSITQFSTALNPSETPSNISPGSQVPSASSSLSSSSSKTTISTAGSVLSTDSESTIVESTTDSLSTTSITSLDSTNVASTPGITPTTDLLSTETISTINSPSITDTTSTDNTLTTNSAPTTDTASSTDFPSFTIPTETILSSPAETSESVAIAPIFLYLWFERSLLQDEKHKQQYIDNVKKSRHSTKALFDRLKNKPPAKPECKKKSLKRSLISGILDAFKEVADLVSCAVDVLDNLVDAVDKIHPPIPEIELLTDTLKDLGNEIKKRGDEQPTSASSDVPSSTSSISSSSCTTAITKTWESILCTVTATSSINRKRKDQGCTTEVYSTVTGCSAIASTITSTTTITPEPTLGLQCAFGNCGGGQSCPQKELELQKRHPLRLSNPEPNTWYGPENYGGSNQNFMAGETWEAYKNGDLRYYRGVKLNPGTTSNLIPFLGQPASLAVAGLYGCTSVIAISRRGAWISHSWEAPSFTYLESDPSPPTDLQQLEIFRRDVLGALHKGNSVDHLYGLSELRVTSNSNQLPTSHLMEDDADPRFPVGLPEAWGQDDGLPSKNQQIENEIRAIFRIPNGLAVPFEKVLYAPRVNWMEEDLGDTNYDSHRGKVLVQYKPAKNCQDKASWRVWFEGHELTDSHQSSWTPSAYQVVDSSQGAMKARQDSTDSIIECPLPSPTASSTDQGTSSSTVTGQISSTDQVSISSTVTALASSIGHGTSSPTAILTSSLEQGTTSLTITPPAAATSQSTLSSTTTSASSTELSSSSSGVALSSSTTDKSTSLSSQSSSTEITSTSLTSENPSSTTSLSSTESPTTSSTTTTELTMESPTEVPTTTSAELIPTPTMNITPLKAFDIVCNNEADFPGHADISSSWQKKFAHIIHTFWKPDGGFMYSSSPVIDAKLKDNHGIMYEYSVAWVPTCITITDGQSFQFPLGTQDVTAEGLLEDNYKLCNNGGVGGSRQVGCLKYTFIGANTQHQIKFTVIIQQKLTESINSLHRITMSAYPTKYDAKGNPTEMKLYATPKDMKKATPSYANPGQYQYAKVEQYTYDPMNGSSSNQASSSGTKKSSSSKKK
ncbi:hypothetical protein GQX73_g10672 [Xylaria multiplex]|uniref:Uncharacterized protein n=1 Tax=Xylaria multiplex TaxID=323545 RepID=A0A7C8IJX7_9PEZI|nr:hypothetical protein GQX73_g10672 [Xylaria multiplex]